MYSLRKAQYDQILQSYLKSIKDLSLLTPNISDIKKIYNMIMINLYNKIERTYKNEIVDEFDITKWNNMLTAIENDINILENHANNNISDITNILDVFDVISSFILMTSDNIYKSVSKIYLSSDLSLMNTASIPINLVKYFDVNKSENIYIDMNDLYVKIYTRFINDNTNLYPSINKTIDRYLSTDSMKYIKNGYADTTQNIFSYISEYIVNMEMIYEITIHDDIEFNCISIILDDTTKYTINIEISNKDTKLSLSNIKSDTVMFKKGKYKTIKFTLIQNKPSSKKMNDFEYVYHIKDIIISNKTVVESAKAYFSGIELYEYFNSISLDVSCSNNNFKYYIIYNNNYYDVTAIGTENKFVQIGKNNVQFELNPENTEWKLLKPDYSFGGNSIYNILDIKKDSDYIDSEGKIKESENTNDITIYRGYQDWLITKQSRNNKFESNKIMLVLNRNENNILTNTSNTLQINVTTLNIISYDTTHITDGYALFMLNGEVIDIDSINIYDAITNEKIYVKYDDTTPITYDSGTNISTIKILVDTENGYGITQNIQYINITYNISLVSYCKYFNYNIIIDSLSIYDENGIEVNKSSMFSITKQYNSDGSIKNYILNVSPYVSYKYILYNYGFTVLNMEPINIYTTTVVCETPETIKILPFSKKEIIAGNYHKINDEDVSQLSSYTLQQGRNYITTTQPFPSLYKNSNTYFKNSITNERSYAGIVLEDYLNYYAYDKPLTRISAYELSLIIPKSDYRQFAFENGKIYLNNIPESIPLVYFSDVFELYNTTGRTLLCKKPIYNSSYVVTDYEVSQECFFIQYNINNIQDNTIDICIEYNNDNKDIVEQPNIYNIKLIQGK